MSEEPQAKGKPRRLRHPGGRKIRSVSMSATHELYAEDLASRMGTTVSGVLGWLLHEHALRETPPRVLPFELQAR